MSKKNGKKIKKLEKRLKCLETNVNRIDNQSSAVTKIITTMKKGEKSTAYFDDAVV